MKIKVNSYYRNSPIKVNVNGKHAETIKLTRLAKSRYARFMDRLERYFQLMTYGVLAVAGAYIIVGVSSEVIGHAMASEQVIESPYLIKDFPPILRKICHAESGGKQFLKSGKVVSHKNTNGTTDWGICQINSIHLERAEKLGYDVINSEKDNKAFARVLFMEQGSVPWRSSSHLWLK